MSATPPLRPDAGDGAHLLEHGPALLQRLHALLRAGRLYDVTNQALQHQLRELLGLVNALLEDEHEVALAAVAGYFYLNGVRLRVAPSLSTMYHSLLGEFESRQIGGIRVLTGVSGPELERFLQLFIGASDPVAAEHLPAALQEASIEHVILVPAQDLEAEDLARDLEQKPDADSERGRARRVFWRAVLGTKKILLRANQSGRPDLRQAKRLVQPVVDSIMKNEYSIVGLTALKDHDEYTYAHCVNVSVLSVSMGQVLGLPRQTLADLGVAALLHDVGKLAVAGEILRKPAKLTSDEWAAVCRHPIEGVKMMTRMPGLSSVTVDTMRVCLEHHMNFDHTGYPEIDQWGQGTLARIVSVADCFDAITAHRAYHKRPMSSFEALQLLLGPGRVHFDPAVLWSLLRTVGLYPAGSVLLTASNHVALSLSPNPADLRRPHTRILVRPDGTSPSEDAPELWDPMPANETVERVLQPEEHNGAQELLAA